MPAKITATQQASDLIGTLIGRHGSICFHMSGRYGTTLVCLPRDELRLGQRDVLIGDYCTTPLYMMSSEAERWRSRDIVITLARGHAPGFSLESGSGYRFEILCEAACPVC